MTKFYIYTDNDDFLCDTCYEESSTQIADAHAWRTQEDAERAVYEATQMRKKKNDDVKFFILKLVKPRPIRNYVVKEADPDDPAPRYWCASTEMWVDCLKSATHFTRDDAIRTAGAIEERHERQCRHVKIRKKH